jgi:hypothetical protein
MYLSFKLQVLTSSLSLPSSATFDNAKRRKKGNPEREREQTLSQDSPPPSERQHRTPSTYPRTRITPSTPTSQRVALENVALLGFQSEKSYVSRYRVIIGLKVKVACPA